MREFRRIGYPRQAVSRALNKTARTVTAKTARLIRDTGYNIPVRDIKQSLNTKPASAENLGALVTASGRPIPLIRYGAREQRRPGGGVSVKVLRGKKFIRGAFIATMPTGHRGVFIRVGSAAHTLLSAGRQRVVQRGKTSYKHGLPIEELYGPSIPIAFVNQKVSAAMVGVARERFPIVLKQELNFESIRR